MNINYFQDPKKTRYFEPGEALRELENKVIQVVDEMEKSTNDEQQKFEIGLLEQQAISAINALEKKRDALDEEVERQVDAR